MPKIQPLEGKSMFYQRQMVRSRISILVYVCVIYAQKHTGFSQKYLFDL
jgi:hypothetical protein